MRPLLPLFATIAFAAAPPAHAETRPGTEPLRATLDPRKKGIAGIKAKRPKRYSTGKAAARILRGVQVRLKNGIRNARSRMVIQRRKARSGLALYEFQ